MEGEALAGTSWILTGSTLTEKEVPDAGITADFFEEQMSGSGAGEQLLRRLHHRGREHRDRADRVHMMAGSRRLMQPRPRTSHCSGRSIPSSSARQARPEAAGVDVLDYVPASEAGSSTDVSGAGTRTSTWWPSR